jgi:hypothetical protein
MHRAARAASGRIEMDAKIVSAEGFFSVLLCVAVADTVCGVLTLYTTRRNGH